MLLAFLLDVTGAICSSSSVSSGAVVGLAGRCCMINKIHLNEIIMDECLRDNFRALNNSR